MGWDSNPSWKSKEEALYDLLEGDGYHIVEKSIKGDVGYCAVKHPKGYVFGLVALFSKQDIGYAVKLMDESMGPHCFDCPKKVLHALTPLDEMYAEGEGKYARDWRREVERFHARPRLKDDDIVRFSERVFFDHFHEDVFTVVKSGRETLFRARNGRLCRIKGYTSMMYEVANRGDQA